jgi:high affinity sulfate transporter 1
MSATETKPPMIALFEGLRPFDKARLGPDIIAGITLAALALPEVLGYTKIAGTPVITGIYTMLAPMILYAIFGGSRHLVVGADSATAAILAASLTAMNFAPESPAWMAQAQVLALLAAGFLILARVLRLGFLADFLSRTVLVGFLTGVGIQVAIGQMTEMLGLPKAHGGTLQKIQAIAQHISETNIPSLGVAAATLAVILGAHHVSKKIPGALIAVTGAILAARFFGIDKMGVKLVGHVPGGLPGFGLPAADWSWHNLQELLPTAFAMFVVILAQSCATSRAFAAAGHERCDENADLLGLALANIGAAFTGTFVVNGSPTKTQMVSSAGGGSQVSQLAASLCALLVLLFLTRPLELLPEPALAAIIFRIGFDLVNVGALREIYAARRSEFWIALVTALVVVFVGVEQSILLAIVLSLLDHTRQGYRPHNALLVRDNTHGVKAQPLDMLGRSKRNHGSEPLQLEPGLMVYRFSHSIYYANTELLFTQVTGLVATAQAPIKWFCIYASAIDDVDYTGAATLRALHEVLTKAGVRLVFAEVSPEVHATLQRYQLTGLIGPEAFFDTVGNLVHAYTRVACGHGAARP